MRYEIGLDTFSHTSDTASLQYLTTNVKLKIKTKIITESRRFLFKCNTQKEG